MRRLILFILFTVSSQAQVWLIDGFLLKRTIDGRLVSVDSTVLQSMITQRILTIAANDSTLRTFPSGTTTKFAINPDSAMVYRYGVRSGANLYATTGTVAIAGGLEVYTKVTGLTTSTIETSLFESTGSTIVAKASGLYYAYTSLSFSASNNNRNIHASIFINGTDPEIAECERKISNAGDVGNMSTGAVFSLTANDTLSVRMEDATGSNTITLNHVVFAVHPLFTVSGAATINNYVYPDTNGLHSGKFNVRPTFTNLADSLTKLATDTTGRNISERNITSGAAGTVLMSIGGASPEWRTNTVAEADPTAVSKASATIDSAVARDPFLSNEWYGVIQKVPNTATLSVFNAASTTSGTVSSNDTLKAWNRYETTIAANTAGQGYGTSQPPIMPDRLPTVQMRVRTYRSIENIGFWCGIFSTLAGVDSVPNCNKNVCAFRYYSGWDGTAYWTCVTGNPSTGAKDTTVTSVAIALNTEYVLTIVPYAGNVKYYINGTLVATHTTNAPAAGGSQYCGLVKCSHRWTAAPSTAIIKSILMHRFVVKQFN